MSNQTVAQEIASRFVAYRNCDKRLENDSKDQLAIQWAQQHHDAILALVKRYLPSGAGFDDGTHFSFQESSSVRLVFHCLFHHMDDAGFYTKWTSHRVIVTPEFAGIDVKVMGPNPNQIKDFIGDCFYNALQGLIQPENVTLQPLVVE